MIKSVHSWLKDTARNVIDYRKLRVLHQGEITKFQDLRRKAIYETVHLTAEQEKSVENLYEENYGKKIPLIWHRHFTAFTGQFDVNYFPELLYIPEFEYYMNHNRSYIQVFQDKNVLPKIAKTAGIQTPHAYFSCTNGFPCNEMGEYESVAEAAERLANAGNLFLKPTIGTDSGVGCRLLEIKNGVDTISSEPLIDILHKMGQNFVVQERLSCHESIKKIYPNSVNTFRVISYLWKGKVEFTPSIMRIGQGDNYLDNAHAGGMFIAIDDDGTLHDKAFTEFCTVYEEHPNTHLKFTGYKISGFPKVLTAAKTMHEAIPQIGVVNWDFTLDKENQPVLIEANLSGGSIWMSQMSHGKGIFGNKTQEILRWLRHMNQMNYVEREEWFKKNIKC